MATHDYVIDNSTGANVRADINLVLQAILTNNSSSSAPSTTAAYMWWADTTNGVLKIRNSSNNDWVELLQLDGTLTLEDGSASTPGLAFRDDLNTGIFSSAADTFNVATAGVERMELGATTIFNEDGADVDFRIEGDTEANLFYVDAGNDRIGIGTNSPATTLQVDGKITVSSTLPEIFLTDTNASNARARINANGGGLLLGADNDNAAASSVITFEVDGSEKARIDSSGRLLIGTTSSRSVAGGQSRVQIENTSTEGLSVVRTSNDNGTSLIAIGKTRNGAIVQDDDVVGTLGFYGDDGNDIDRPTAEIRSAVDGTPGADDMPGRLEFKTTADGASSPTERMRIDSSGHMGLGVTPDDSWPSNGDFRALQIGTGACVFGRGSGDEDRGGISVNYYHTGSAEKYLANGNASGMLLNDGDIDFFVAAANSSGVDAAMSKTIAMRIAADADIGVGTLDPRAKTEIYDSSVSAAFSATDLSTWRVLQIRNNIESATGTAAGIAFGGDGSSDTETAGICGISTNSTGGVVDLAFLTAESNASKERMRILSDGEFIIGNTSSPGTSHAGISLRSTPSGLPTYILTSSRQHGSSAYTHQEFFNTNGSVGSITTSGSGTTYSTSSDYRLKENETAITDGITRLKQLKPYKFNWKADASTIVDGFFAHEVSSIVPEAVTGDKDYVATQANVNSGHAENVGDPIYQKIDHSRLVPLLVAAVKELITKVETLEAA